MNLHWTPWVKLAAVALACAAIATMVLTMGRSREVKIAEQDRSFHDGKPTSEFLGRCHGRQVAAERVFWLQSRYKSTESVENPYIANREAIVDMALAEFHIPEKIASEFRKQSPCMSYSMSFCISPEFRTAATDFAPLPFVRDRKLDRAAERNDFRPFAAYYAPADECMNRIK